MDRKTLGPACACLLLLAAAACHQQAGSSAAPRAAVQTNATPVYYQAKGVVREVKPATRAIVIQHEAIPDYMPAMTMPFDVKDAAELNGLAPGDTVSFRLVVVGDDAWADQFKRLSAANPSASPQTGEYRLVRDVEPLKIGDPLPDYHFTNQSGHAVSTGQFKGQALAFTFFFTRCPYPTFCPLMSRNFCDAQRKLSALASGPTNWHLLSVSFDPAFDTPDALKKYSESYECDPKHWDFVTGDLTDITALSEQVGENFWREGAGIAHNLRTVVVDARGRIQTIIPENKWTSDQLVEEMLKAAAARP